MSGNKENFYIVIDVGHGAVHKDKHVKGHEDGFDSGQIGRYKGKQVTEYQLNLQNAEILRKELEKKGYHVVLTTDKGERHLPVGNGQNFSSRVNVAYKYDEQHQTSPDKFDVIYISMHANWNPSKKLHGTSLYVQHEDETTGVTSSSDSKQLAMKMRESLVKAKLPVAGEVMSLESGHEGPLNYMRKDFPGILLEADFMSNKLGMQRLKSPREMKKLFSVVAKSIDEFVVNYVPSIAQPIELKVPQILIDALHLQQPEMLGPVNSLRSSGVKPAEQQVVIPGSPGYVTPENNSEKLQRK